MLPELLLMVFAAMPPAASARPDLPDPPPVQTVEVPVVVHDRGAEAVRMGVAAAIGAAVAAEATSVRLRRRRPSAGPQVIDMTDQSSR